jgi:hypothetical protein
MDENPKSEYRNPKQIRMTECPKWLLAGGQFFVVSDFEIGSFEFVSDFVFRASDLLTGRTL